MGASAQADVQYSIADNEYSYRVQIENVTDADDAKLPLALFHELLGSMPEFDQDTHIISIASRKNISKPLIRERFEEHDYVFILLEKEERNRSEQEDGE